MSTQKAVKKNKKTTVGGVLLPAHKFQQQKEFGFRMHFPVNSP